MNIDNLYKDANLMIVCINTAGNNPVIKYMDYDSEDKPADTKKYAKLLKDDFDEVYLINIDTQHRDFIKEIMEHGTRI